ncbi:MAG: helix-turn-helix transcriptional regulator [Elainellaceae cyanobacterium]
MGQTALQNQVTTIVDCPSNLPTAHSTACAAQSKGNDSISETVVQLQLGSAAAAEQQPDSATLALIDHVSAEAAQASGVSWQAVVEQVLTSADLDQLITRLQTSPPFIQSITQQLFQHLINQYRQQVAIAVAADGLSAVDLNQPHLRLQTSRKASEQQASGTRSQQLDIVIDAAVVQTYLCGSLTNFFEHSRFRQAFKRFITSHLVAWIMEDVDISALDRETAAIAVQQHLRQTIPHWADKIERLGTIYSVDITQMVIDSLNLQQCLLKRLEALMGLRLRPEITLDNALDLPNVAPIPTSIPIASSIRAQLRPDLWQRDSDLAVFQYRSKSNPANYIEHYITDPGDIALLPWEAAEQIINKFGFDTVKLQMIFAARAMDQDEPWSSTFCLRATDIVQLLGWDRNHNTSLPEKRNTIASAAHALSCLLVKSVWIEGRGKRRVDASTPVGRMWDVLVDPHGQIDWVTGKIERPDEVYVTVTPGLWTKHFLNRAGHKAKAALHQFGYLARDILQIDPYHHEMALRLAIQLTLDARVRVHNQHPYNYQVVALLKEVMPAAEISRALEDKYKARDLKNRWNRALTLLVSLGWQIEYDPHTYPDWLQPNSTAARPSDWRRIKIIERLLQAHLVIRPPQPIPQLLAQVKSPPHRLKGAKARSLPATQPNTSQASRRSKTAALRDITGDEVREGRKARGWSRKELGGFLGVSADYVGKLERGDRVITPPLHKRLCKLLSLSQSSAVAKQRVP